MSDIEKKQPSVGDMSVDEFRAAAHRVADMMADYLERLESYRVVPDLQPGQIRAQLPPAPPEQAEAVEAILADYARLIEPNITHWQHPGFMAYFNSVACGPGILGEWLASGLNSNVMFWRNAPASTELEEVVIGWLARLLGLPETLDGMFTDTASISSLMSLVAARHTVPGLDSRDRGLAGRADTKRLRMYASAEAHGSIDKGAIVAGIGREGVRHIESDAGFRMRPEALARAIEEDRRADWLPFCVVGTMGTTSSASIDPAAPIADICEREGLWFHVDAAYGGAAALAAEKRPLFAGWERADSIVVNAHKWMFTPFDASILFFKHPDRFREAFSLVPEYLKGSRQEGAHNYNEYGMQLGRRFRALKVWMQLRYFGAKGMAARIREHCAMATELADRVAAEPDWEVMAPVDLALVCLRHCPPGLKGDQLDRHNDRILDEVNATGQIYLSHTRLDGRYAIRVALGNPRATRDHVDLCWRLLRESAEKT